MMTIFVLKKIICTENYLQLNPINLDTKRAIESVRINEVSVLSGSCY